MPMLIFEAFWGIIAGITEWNPVASQGGRIGLTVFPAMIVALIIYKRLEKQETKNNSHRMHFSKRQKVFC